MPVLGQFGVLRIRLERSAEALRGEGVVGHVEVVDGRVVELEPLVVVDARDVRRPPVLDVGVVVARVGLPAVHHDADEVVLVAPQQWPQAG